MSISYNYCSLMGRLTKDPELTESDSMIKLRFSLAVQRTYKNASGNYDTDFIQVVLYGVQAQNAYKLLKKGSAIFVWGKILVNSYTNDDKRQWITMVKADNFQLISSPSGMTTKKVKSTKS